MPETTSTRSESGVVKWFLGLDGCRHEVVTEVPVSVPVTDELGALVLGRYLDCFEAGPVEDRFKGVDG